jgi:hypothetical protein
MRELWRLGAVIALPLMCCRVAPEERLGRLSKRDTVRIATRLLFGAAPLLERRIKDMSAVPRLFLDTRMDTVAWNRSSSLKPEQLAPLIESMNFFITELHRGLKDAGWTREQLAVLNDPRVTLAIRDALAKELGLTEYVEFERRRRN